MRACREEDYSFETNSDSKRLILCRHIHFLMAQTGNNPPFLQVCKEQASYRGLINMDGKIKRQKGSDDTQKQLKTLIKRIIPV